MPGRVPTATVGGSLTISGSGFGACADAGEDAGPVAPLQAIRLFVVQGGTRVSVAQVGADESLRFSTTVGVPEGVVTGPAQVRAFSDERATKLLALATFDVAAS